MRNAMNSTMKRTFLPAAATAALVVAIGLAAPAPQAIAKETASELPAWLQESLSRETRRRGKKRTVSVLDGALETTVKSRSEITPENAEWGTYFTVDIGSGDANIECYVFSEPNEPAKLLNLMANQSMELIAQKNNSTLETKSVLSLSVDRVGAHPYMLVEWLYVLQTEGGEKRVGQSKVASAVIDQTVITCDHPELGYSDTFRQAFVDILTKAKVKNADSQAFFRELYFMEVQQQRVGFVRTRYALDADGDIQISASDAVAVAVDAATLATTDSYSAEWVRPDGTVINAYTNSVENGELTMELSFEPAEADGWIIDGEIQGKPFNTTLDGAARVESNLVQIQTIRDVIGSPERQTGTQVAWLPDANPAALTEIVFTQDGNDLKGTLGLGPMNMAVTLAKDGMLEEMNMDAGGATVRMERVWFDGSVPELVR